MEIFSDIFAGWAYELHEKIEKKDFSRLIEILHTSNILNIETIYFSDKKELFHSISRTVDLFFECYENNEVLFLEGTTILHVDSDIKKIEGAISLIYEPFISLISIDTYTDAWMPIGFFDEILQIDTGILNSKRLKSVLRQISQLRFIKRIEPEDNEYFHDYMIHQIGFNLFYKGSINHIKDLTEKDYNKIVPFILSD